MVRLPRLSSMDSVMPHSSTITSSSTPLRTAFFSTPPTCPPASSRIWLSPSFRSMEASGETPSRYPSVISSSRSSPRASDCSSTTSAA